MHWSKQHFCSILAKSVGTKSKLKDENTDIVYDLLQLSLSY